MNRIRVTERVAHERVAHRRAGYQLYQPYRLYRLYRLVGLVLLVFGLVCTGGRAARAGALAVTSTADSGAGSLRAVVASAAAGDTITFNVSGIITLTSGQITLDKALTLQGPGAQALAIDGNQASRIFYVSAAAGTVALSGLTLQNGYVYNDESAGLDKASTGSTLTLTDCVVAHCFNDYGGVGGGLFSAGGTTILTRCLFTGNSAASGGGVEVLDYSGRANTTVTNCVFRGNSGGEGAAYYNGGSASTLTNCVFVGNSTDTYGGAFFSSKATTTLTNCTFTGNRAADYGGAYVNFDSATTLTNCIFYGDAAGQSAPEIWQYHGAAATIKSCLVQGNSGTPAAPDGGGNFSADPQFVRRPDLTATVPDGGDLHLQAGSPCIDAGSDAVVTVPPFPADSSGNPLDLDGKARIPGKHVDLGAYAFHPEPDTTPPSITATANKTQLWPPSGLAVPVVVTGKITDNAGGSGVDPATVCYTVTDEYSQNQPAGAITLAADGSYSFTLYLPASRLDTDLNGRTFTICVSAKDKAGNSASKSVVVTVPHDTGKK